MDKEIPDEETVFRLAELQPSGELTYDPHIIGPWCLPSQPPPHELSILRGRNLTADEARVLRKFKEPGKDEKLIPYRRTIKFKAGDVRSCGKWILKNSAINNHKLFEDNAHHAHISPWHKRPYDGNFTMARKKILKKMEWATGVEGTKWEDYPLPDSHK